MTLSRSYFTIIAFLLIVASVLVAFQVTSPLLAVFPAVAALVYGVISSRGLDLRIERAYFHFAVEKTWPALLFLVYGLLLHTLLGTDITSFTTWVLCIGLSAVFVLFSFDITSDTRKLTSLFQLLSLVGLIVAIVTLVFVARTLLQGGAGALALDIALETPEIGARKNVFGSLLMFSVIPALHDARTRKRLTSRLSFAIQLLAVFVLLARSVWLASIVALLSYWLLRTGRYRTLRALYVAAITLLAILLVSVSLSGSLLMRLDDSDVLGSLTTDRNSLWAAAVRSAQEKPFGYGVSNDKLAIRPYIRGPQYIRGKGTHNTFMRYLVSLGYVGVFLYFLVIAQPYVLARREDFENVRSPFIPLLATYNGLIGYHLTEVLLLGGFSFRSMVFTMLYFMVIIGFSRQRYIAVDV